VPEPNLGFKYDIWTRTGIMQKGFSYNSLQLNAVNNKSTQDLYIKQMSQHAPGLAFHKRGRAVI
jgi:hypothetical protein